MARRQVSPEQNDRLVEAEVGVMLCGVCMLFIYIVCVCILFVWGLKSFVDLSRTQDLSRQQYIIDGIYVIVTVYDITNSILMTYVINCGPSYPRAAMVLLVIRAIALFCIAIADHGSPGYPIFTAHVVYNLVTGAIVILVAIWKTLQMCH
jgi:hypothetical protein